MATYRILSMDGGGLRGVFTARVLEKVVAANPNFLQNTQLFAGTSTGGILALALADNLAPTDILDLYKNKGKIIFKTNLLEEIEDLWGIVHAKYATKPRLEAMQDTFLNKKLKDFLPKNVLVAAFDLDGGVGPASDAKFKNTWKAKFFHNFPGPDSDGEELAANVVTRSSAAPIYFPIFENFVDGGVVANNPSMCALAQALEPTTGKQVLQDVRLLSIGTASTQQSVKSMDGNWGVSQWGFKLIDMLMDGSVGLADYQCKQLLGNCYHRVNANLPRRIGLDDFKAIDDLIALADNSVDYPGLQAWIDANWN